MIVVCCFVVCLLMVVCCWLCCLLVGCCCSLFFGMSCLLFDVWYALMRVGCCVFVVDCCLKCRVSLAVRFLFVSCVLFVVC